MKHSSQYHAGEAASNVRHGIATIVLALAALASIMLLGGCTAFNPRTLTQPTPTPEAAFRYNLHALEVDAEGNERIADGDTIEVDQTALKDNWSINLDRSYYDTTAMPRDGMNAIADVLKIHAANGTPPTPEQLMLYAGAIETVANYNIPLILQGEKVDVQRANDPEAFAAARVAQFGAAADLAKYQTSEARKLAQSFTPYGAASGAFDTLAGMISAKREAVPPAPETPAAPEAPTTEATPEGEP